MTLLAGEQPRTPEPFERECAWCDAKGGIVLLSPHSAGVFIVACSRHQHLAEQAATVKRKRNAAT